MIALFLASSPRPDTIRAMPPLRRWLLPTLFLGLAACGHGKDVADRRFDELGSQILRLQADQDELSQRLGALEDAEVTKQQVEGSSKEGGAQQDKRAPLRVVKLAPAGERSLDDAPPADAVDPPGSEPRPVVRVVGQSATVQNLD